LSIFVKRRYGAIAAMRALATGVIPGDDMFDPLYDRWCNLNAQAMLLDMSPGAVRPIARRQIAGAQHSSKYSSQYQHSPFYGN
jgi:hypothetical protein